MATRNNLNSQHHNARNAMIKKPSPYPTRRSTSRPLAPVTRSSNPHASLPPTGQYHQKHEIIHRRASTDHHDSTKDQTFSDMDEDHTREDPGSEDSFFRWDEEATLLSDLMEDAPHQTEDEKLMLLVEGLQTPFADEGKLLKKQIAETLVPTVNRVKASYKALEDKVDPSYGKGIVLFNQGCKDIDETMYEQQIDLQEAFQKTQGRVTQLFEELKEEYAIRDQLWADLKESIDDIVIHALKIVKDTPARIEQTIVQLDKRNKSLEMGASTISSVEKEFKELFKKVA